MIEIKRYCFRAPNGKTTEEHLTLEEGAAKYPGWKPWLWSLRVERIAEPTDPVAPMPPSLHAFISPTWKKMGEP